MHLPRVLSPQMHRRIDLVALPSVIASVVWMSREPGDVLLAEDTSGGGIVGV
jgi:hypothetical protein